MPKKRITFKEFLSEFYTTDIKYKTQKIGNKTILIFNSPEDLLRFDSSEIQNKSEIGKIRYTDTTIEYISGD